MYDMLARYVLADRSADSNNAHDFTIGTNIDARIMS